MNYKTKPNGKQIQKQQQQQKNSLGFRIVVKRTNGLMQRRRSTSTDDMISYECFTHRLACAAVKRTLCYVAKPAISCYEADSFQDG